MGSGARRSAVGKKILLMDDDAVLRQSLEEPSVYLRIGRENPAPELRSLSLVAANYGVPRRNLGAVSVIGPVRMDYPRAIMAVRHAASAVSEKSVATRIRRNGTPLRPPLPVER